MIRLENVRLFTGEAVFEHGTVITEGTRIHYAGDAALSPETPKAQVISGHGALCMPGLVNSHGHAPMVLLRGAGSDLPLMDWLGKVMPMEDHLTPEHIYNGSILAIAELLRNGTTTYADMYYHMDAAFQAVIDTGIRANLCRGSSNRAGVDSHEAWYRTYNGAQEDRIRVYVGLHAEYTSDPDTVSYAARAAQRLGTGVQVHLSETKQEVEECLSRRGKTPPAYFRDLGLFEVPTLAAHCVHPQEGDWEILQNAPVTVAHCPGSNLKLASGVAPVSKYLGANIPVCLGTDGAASENGLDLFREIWLASLLQKGTQQDAAQLPARQALQMATHSGALGLGFPDVGLLKPGYKADLILLSPDCLSFFPGKDLESDLAYSACGRDVTLTMVNGKILYQNGEFMTIDLEKARYLAKQSADALWNH